MSENRDDADKADKADEAKASKNGSGDRTDAKAKKVGGAPVVPTGKAGRGSMVERRVRTDADEPEETRSKRANPVEYVGQVVSELRKVIWPTRMQMVTYTAVVFIFLVFMTLLVAGVDYGGGKAVEWTFGR